ncbi:MAG: hypothetical protein ABIV11_07185 [Gemmatimonadaceae bacterium]
MTLSFTTPRRFIPAPTRIHEEPEIYAPGIFASGDIDLIVEARSSAGSAGVRERTGAVLAELGFEQTDRHWTKGDLFVEVPGHFLDDPAETMHAGPFVFRVVAKEALLVDRLAGFKHWQHTSYGQQAIDWSDGAVCLALGRIRLERIFEGRKVLDERETHPAMLDELSCPVLFGKHAIENGREFSEGGERLHEVRGVRS